MTIGKAFKWLWLRQADNSAAYHLLENESDQIEKGEDAETANCDLKPNALSDTALEKEKSSWRWLRMLQALLPSFLHTSASQVEPKTLRPTAWLG